MKIKPKGLGYFLFCCSTLSGAALAGTMGGMPISNHHFEAIGALGAANLRAEDGYLGITESETDRLVQTNSNKLDFFTGQLGLGLVYYLHGSQLYSEDTQWFPWIEPQVNGYYIGENSIEGDVLRFESPDFNDMSYKMSIESYRVMFDTALTIASNKHLSLFVIGGVGNAWNRASYSDSDRSSVPCADQSLSLDSTSNSHFSWEAGAGVSIAFAERFAITLEYLYTDLGHIRTAGTGFTGAITTPILVPADFKFVSQSALLGLHVAI